MRNQELALLANFYLSYCNVKEETEMLCSAHYRVMLLLLYLLTY